MSELPPPGLSVELIEHLVAEDLFADVRPAGSVARTRSTSGSARHVTDRERVIAIDNGQLRIGWLAHEGWGRAAVAYGPFADPSGLMLSVSALNGLTSSQSDPRPEGGRAALRRLRATFPHFSPRQPELKDSLHIGWFTSATSSRAPVPVAAVFHRAGADANGELWFQVGTRQQRVAGELQNLPARYLVSLDSEAATLHAWSYAGAHGFGPPGSSAPLARLPLGQPLPSELYAVVHQPVLGEVDYRVDTRIESVHVFRAPGPTASLASDLSWPRFWEPTVGSTVFRDAFEGGSGELDGFQSGDRHWRRLVGDGVFDLTGRGAVGVRADRDAPNPGRTLYGVPWDGSAAEVSVTVTPPGSERGQGHNGRGGVTFWQDPDNYLVVNTFLDDGQLGVSISAFLRTAGHEAMYDWDAVWSNVGRRIHWGAPFRLRVAFDGRQFLCRVGDEPVLYRQLTDYRSDAVALQINSVGLAANWEWGDDTGTVFRDFAVRQLA